MVISEQHKKYLSRVGVSALMLLVDYIIGKGDEEIEEDENRHHCGTEGL